MPVAIRRARAEDAATVVALVRSERLNPTGLDWRNFDVAEADGRIMGAVQIRPKGPELGSLVVRPEARGQGIGDRLVAAALARAQGPVYVICPSALAPLYLRRGFRPTRPLAAPAALRLHFLIGQAAMALALVSRRRPRRLVMLRSA